MALPQNPPMATCHPGNGLLSLMRNVCFGKMTQMETKFVKDKFKGCEYVEISSGALQNVCNLDESRKNGGGGGHVPFHQSHTVSHYAWSFGTDKNCSKLKTLLCQETLRKLFIVRQYCQDRRVTCSGHSSEALLYQYNLVLL